VDGTSDFGNGLSVSCSGNTWNAYGNSLMMFFGFLFMLALLALPVILAVVLVVALIGKRNKHQ
jgi:hypothetical protein